MQSRPPSVSATGWRHRGGVGDDGAMMRRALTAVLLVLAASVLVGCGPTVYHRGGKPAGTLTPADTLTVTSDAFTAGGAIPVEYTCKGAGKAPTVHWSGDLRGATAVAVVVDDPDAPGGTFVHRVVLDIPATVTSLGAATPAGAHEARNSAGSNGWTPPCPPSGTHHYRFTVYGLFTPTGLADGVPAATAIARIEAAAGVTGQLIGTVAH